MTSTYKIKQCTGTFLIFKFLIKSFSNFLISRIVSSRSIRMMDEREMIELFLDNFHLGRMVANIKKSKSLESIIKGHHDGYLYCISFFVLFCFLGFYFILRTLQTFFDFYSSFLFGLSLTVFDEDCSSTLVETCEHWSATDHL